MTDFDVETLNQNNEFSYKFTETSIFRNLEVKYSV